MTKQEFLAMSLPYKLFFRIEYGSTNQPTGIYQMSGVYETSVVEGFNYDDNVKTDKLKPILHPLSDLTKEIEHNGERFIPVLRLLEANDFDINDNPLKLIEKYKGIYFDIDLLSLSDALLLIEWHFAIGLSDEELANILKVSRKTLHNWTQGNTNPNKAKLLRLVEQHNLLMTWLNNGYPEISTLNFECKAQLLSKLEQDDVGVDDFLYFGSGLMLTNSFDVIDNPFV